MSHDLGRRSTSAPADTLGSAHVMGADRLLTAASPAGASTQRTGGRNPAAASRGPNDSLDLERRVRNFLDQRSVPSLRRLAVEADGSSVVLRGTVRSYYEKQLAIHCCQRVAGVLDVVDAIEVSGVGSSVG